MSKELEECWTKLTVVTAELENLKNFKKAPDAVRSAEQLEERLKAAQADKQHAEGQGAAGQCILTPTIDEKNKLQDANIKQAKELKDIRAQLSDALKENKKLITRHI